MIAIDFFKQDGRCSALSLRRKKNIVHTERSPYTRSAGADRKRKKHRQSLTGHTRPYNPWKHLWLHKQPEREGRNVMQSRLRKCCFLLSSNYQCLLLQWKPLETRFASHCQKRVYFAPFTYSTSNKGECPLPFFDLACKLLSCDVPTMQRLR
jgi:hypothetical protein